MLPLNIAVPGDWLYRQVREGKIRGFNFPGDRKTYLLREEEDAYLNMPRLAKDDEE
jgi:hypothetical protein